MSEERKVRVRAGAAAARSHLYLSDGAIFGCVFTRGGEKTERPREGEGERDR